MLQIINNLYNFSNITHKNRQPHKHTLHTHSDTHSHTHQASSLHLLDTCLILDVGEVFGQNFLGSHAWHLKADDMK